MDFLCKSQRLRAWVFAMVLAVVFSASQAMAVPVIDGNGSDADWANATVQLDPANDVLPSPTSSGYDVVEASVFIDATNNDMYFRLKTLGVPGDADGDGDPNNTSDPNVIDEVGVGGMENYQIFLDCDHNGVVDFMIMVMGNTPYVFDANWNQIEASSTTWAMGDGSDDDHKVVEIKAKASEICAAFVAAGGFSFSVQALSGTADDMAPEDLVPDAGFFRVEAIPTQLTSSIDLQKSMSSASAYTGEKVTVTLVVTNDGETPLCDITVTDVLPACLRLVTAADDSDDLDGDGIPNSLDSDMDGDGLANGVDPDEDNDGVRDCYERDADHDGAADKYDSDDDNDGIADTLDVDDNNDGILDVDDFDGDGIANAEDTDVDGDGVRNTRDRDDDNDGIPDTLDNDAAESTLVFNVGCLDPGASQTLTFDATVVCGEAQTVNNTATVQGIPSADADPVTDEASASIDVLVPTAGVEIDKVKVGGPDQVVVNAGNPTLFTLLITVTNTGNTPLANLQVRDKVPYQLAGSNFVSSQGTVDVQLPSGGMCGLLGEGGINWSVGTLAPGATASLQFDEQTKLNPTDHSKYMPNQVTSNFKLNEGAVVKGINAVSGTKVFDGPSLPVVIPAVRETDDGDCDDHDGGGHHGFRKYKHLHDHHRHGHH